MDLNCDAMDRERARKLREAVERYREHIAAFLRELIAIPSTSTNEGACIRRIRDEMARAGFDDVRIDAIGNVIGTMGAGPRKILYDSHIDTVGVGDRLAWRWDPFEGKYEDGVIYGRGASDNKAAIACMVWGARAMRDLGLLPDDVTLYVAGVVQEEECDGWAVHEMITTQGIAPECVVLGECTNLQVHRGHRGRCEIKVTTKGRSCHASAPERGVNAVYRMMPIVAGIEALNSRLKDDPFLGRGTVAVTFIECKTGSLNVVPDECTICVDRRMTVGETAESCIEEIRSLPGAEDAEVSLFTYDSMSHTGYRARWEKSFPAWSLDEGHPLVQAGVRCAEVLFGERPRTGKWVFATDGSATMGRLGIPTIGFGPGEERHSHSVDDQVSVEHLVKSAMLYAAFPAVYREVTS
ncbi:MAG: YgeY family selenium metabolism-linked hydrolase [Firmicutes bacterium]|jgi:putative selenium metabolism hydrolase|nr:YgeY family selenium metabolism-linked hydrolase [Bacillota bacterium]MDH7496031.1 YgeY family selenium metabolism-linked hydrolase [Bacillota bacterium]